MNKGQSFDFYFDISCPFAYMASTMIPSLCERTQATAIYRPILLGGVYDLVKAPQGKNGSASDVMPASKLAIARRDMRMSLQRNKVPLNWPTKHPQSTVHALRLLLSIDPSARPPLVAAFYRAYWVENADFSNEQLLNQMFQRVCGHPPHLKGDEKDLLRSETSQFVERGGFGVPSFFVGDDIFFGSDRVHMLERALRGGTRSPPVPQLRLTNNNNNNNNAKVSSVVFVYDFSSPWSYLASTQIERVCSHGNVRLVLLPVLVGAVFKAVGTPVVPSEAASPQRRQWGARDLMLWSEHWNVSPPVWPSTFPIRSVAALRLHMQDPHRTLHPIFKAAWQQDLDITKDDVLLKILQDAGIQNGHALLEQSKSEQAKEALRKNTERAVELGCCGVPSFIVDDNPVVWGQDRLNVVEDMICGWRFNEAKL